MVSEGRLFDMKTRETTLLVMETLMRSFRRTGNVLYFEKAKHFGLESARLKEKIQSHDYAQDDKEFDFIRQVDKSWDELK